MGRSTAFGFILSFAVIASACTSTTGVDSAPVSEGEAIELIAATLFATFNSTSVIPPRPASLPTGENAPLGWMSEFEAEVRCPGGGRVGMAASVVVRTDPGTGGGEAEYRLRQVHDDCRVQPGGDPVFAISGRPRLEADVEARHDGTGRVEWAGAAAGQIDWVASGRRGTCEVDVRFDGDADGPGRTIVEVEGSVCGHTVRSSVPIR